jgi:hypothetical protein
MAGTIDPSHDRVRLSRDELRVIARLERSYAADDRRTGAQQDGKAGRWSRIRTRFRRTNRDG